MKSNKYVSAFVVEPYYYYYHSVPYFESMYIAEHDMTYRPDKVSSRLAIIQDDDTRIELFDGCSTSKSFYLLLILLIIIAIFYHLSKNKI